MDLEEIQIQCMQDSEAWFPDVSHSLQHNLIGLVGEVGEFANIFKKMERGSLDFPGEGDINLWALRSEIADIFIYLCNIAVLLDTKLEAIYQWKREQNVERFGSTTEEPSGTAE